MCVARRQLVCAGDTLFVSTRQLVHAGDNLFVSKRQVFVLGTTCLCPGDNFLAPTVHQRQLRRFGICQTRAHPKACVPGGGALSSCWSRRRAGRPSSLSRRRRRSSWRLRCASSAGSRGRTWTIFCKQKLQIFGLQLSRGRRAPPPDPSISRLKKRPARKLQVGQQFCKLDPGSRSVPNILAQSARGSEPRM